MRTLSIVWIFAALTFVSCRNIGVRYAYEDNILKIETSKGVYQISAITDDIIKTDFLESEFDQNEVYAAVLRDPIPMKINKQRGKILGKTANLEFVIENKPFKISFLNPSTQELISTHYGFELKGDSIEHKIDIQEGEKIFGTGARAIKLDRRGENLDIYNQPQYGYEWGDKNLNFCLPHFMSSNNYMILIDNPAKAYIDVGKIAHNQIKYKSGPGNTSQYFIRGDDFAELMLNYTDLTGKQPLPPIWAFGHLQSKFGYRDQAEAIKMLNKTISLGIPVDAIILDIFWFGPEIEDGKMGQLDWDLVNWPDPKGMISGFADKGVKTIAVSEPFFTRKSKHFEFLDSMKYLATDSLGNTLTIRDFYFGDAGLLDIFQPEAKDWIWDQYKYMKSYGIEGWWVDLGEPEKHPDSMVHINGNANEIHGIYGDRWAEMLMAGYKRDYPRERLFHMGRSGYAGSQRNGLIPWTGDVGRNWNGFKPQVSMMLSMGLSGIAYMHSDAGGFSVGEADEELYIRWMQFATFTPIFRPHGDSSIPSELALWPEEVQEILIPFVKLRYKMLPYNYTLAFENSMTGMPMARPLFTEFSEVSDSTDQYLWGKNMMICPVLEKGKTKMNITIPGGPWYDYWSGKKYERGDHEIDLNLENIPVFIRSGATIVQTSDIQNTSQYNAEKIHFKYYMGNESSESLVYLDDGKTPNAFEKNEYQIIRVKSVPSETNLEFSIILEGAGYSQMPREKEYRFEIIGLTNEPQSVQIDEPVNFNWNDNTGILSFEWKDHEGFKINLKY